MIKSIIRKSEYRAIYKFLDRVSPLDIDCGGLCASVCCGTSDDRQWDREMGIYLLPGEDKVQDRDDDWLTWSEESTEDYEFPPSWNGKVFFVKCKNPPDCPREKRPLQCRTFPLEPHFLDEGHLILIWDSSPLPYVCPLIAEKRRLNESFMRATYTVWKHLVRDPLILDLVESDSAEREKKGVKIEIVYDPLRPDIGGWFD